MKTVGRIRHHPKGFHEALNRFFQLAGEFRKDAVFIPTGVYRFRTFAEAEQWRHKMLRGHRPDLPR